MKTSISRRAFIKQSALAAGAVMTAPWLSSCASGRGAGRAGPFSPTWESLAQNYHCPDWFRDAKFGIWAHWSAQCVPEQGDWYARRMYLQGDQAYHHHVAHYGHPSQSGPACVDQPKNSLPQIARLEGKSCLDTGRRRLARDAARDKTGRRRFRPQTRAGLKLTDAVSRDGRMAFRFLRSWSATVSIAARSTVETVQFRTLFLQSGQLRVDNRAPRQIRT